MAASLGKMPTTSVRRLISRVRALERIGGVHLRPVLGGEVHVGEHIGLRRVHQLGELGQLRAELVGHAAPCCLRRRRVLLGEGGGDEGGNHALSALAGMGEGVAHEMHPAALPAGARAPGRRPP